MENELKQLIDAVLDSADDTGCDGDLTVVSASAIEALSEYVYGKTNRDLIAKLRTL